jgi:hypothetical protein
LLLRRQRSGESRLKGSLANSSRDPLLKKPFTKKKAGGVAQGEGPEFKPQYRKTKQSKKNPPKT